MFWYFITTLTCYNRYADDIDLDLVLPFHTSTLLDRNRPSNSGVLTALARNRAGAAMCMRSTHGCGTLAGPSLVLMDFRWSKVPLKTKEISRRSRSETSRRAWKTRQARKRAAEEEESTWRNMTFIYHSYTVHISMLIKEWNPRNCVMPPA